MTAAEVEEVMDGVADAEGMIDYAAFIKKVNVVNVA